MTSKNRQIKLGESAVLYQTSHFHYWRPNSIEIIVYFFVSYFFFIYREGNDELSSIYLKRNENLLTFGLVRFLAEVGSSDHRDSISLQLLTAVGTYWISPSSGFGDSIPLPSAAVVTALSPSLTVWSVAWMSVTSSISGSTWPVFVSTTVSWVYSVTSSVVSL